MSNYVLSVNKTAGAKQPYPRVNEGQSFVITITNEDLSADRSVDFEITGVSANDISVSGASVTLADDNPSYTGSLKGSFSLEVIRILENGVLVDDRLEDTITVTVSNDIRTEGFERFTLSLVDYVANQIIVDIADTSIAPLTEFDVGSSIVAQKTQLRNEYFDNGNFTITVSVDGPQYNGVTSLPYIVHGPAGLFITPSSGTISLSSGTGSVTFTKNVPNDLRINDLVFDLRVNNEISLIEFPIFRERPPITYELIVDQPIITNSDNNRSVTFTLITTGLDQGTVIGYTCFGDTDDVNGTTSGDFVLDADGTDTVTLSHVSVGSNYNKTGTVILRLDNGQATARVTLRESTATELIDGMVQVASVLDSINNNMIQSNARLELILQSIVHQLINIREDLRGGSGVETLARLAENQGIRITKPYGELEQAAIYKGLILEGGLLEKSGARDDSNVASLLAAIKAKPDQELKAESMKYLNDILSQLRSSLGNGF